MRIDEHNKGALFKVEWIDVNLIRVDPAYQRPLNMTWVRETAKNFDWRLFDPLNVSIRDGCYWAVDGRHRKALAEFVGETHVPCVLRQYETQAEEAEAFHDHNVNRRRMEAAARFKGRLLWDEKAIEIRDICLRAGVHLWLTSKNPPAHSTQAVSAVERVYNRGAILLEDTLAVLCVSFNGDPATLNYVWIDGMSMFLERYSDIYRPDILVPKLSGETPASVKRVAGSYHVDGRSSSFSHAYAFLSIYNARLRSNRLPEERMLPKQHVGPRYDTVIAARRKGIGVPLARVAGGR